MLEDSFLTQIITQPTRENILPDLVLLSESDLGRECQVGEKLSGCDHHLICLTIRTVQELIENKYKNFRLQDSQLQSRLRAAVQHNLGTSELHSYWRGMEHLQAQTPRSQENFCSHED